MKTNPGFILNQVLSDSINCGPVYNPRCDRTFTSVVETTLGKIYLNNILCKVRSLGRRLPIQKSAETFHISKNNKDAPQEAANNKHEVDVNCPASTLAHQCPQPLSKKNCKQCCKNLQTDLPTFRLPH